jgi:hypothetical protein
MIDAMKNRTVLVGFSMDLPHVVSELRWLRRFGNFRRLLRLAATTFVLLPSRGFNSRVSRAC